MASEREWRLKMVVKFLPTEELKAVISCLFLTKCTANNQGSPIRLGNPTHIYDIFISFESLLI